jgi:hypothetical protein
MLSMHARGGCFPSSAVPAMLREIRLEQAGFTVFEHLQLSEMGLEIGTRPAADEVISVVVKKWRGPIMELPHKKDITAFKKRGTIHERQP